MSRRNLEKMPLLMQRTTNGFVTADGYSFEEIDQYPIGAILEFHVVQRRSPPRHRLYWAILKRCVDNSDNKYGSARDLHGAIKIELGYEHRVRRIGNGPGAQLLASAKYCLNKLNILRMPKIPQVSGWLDRLDTILNQLDDYVGDTIVLPGSIAWSEMDEAEFKVFFDKAMLALEIAGYPITEYLKDAEKQSQVNKQYQSYPRNGESNGRRQTSRSRDRRVAEEAGREEAA